ncbi:MAG: hypothetical protein WBK51_16430 [Polaromonas sp.]
MIVLLPLRGWAGDVMAVEMASTAIAIKSEAVGAHKIAATASFDHQNQASAATQALPDCHEQLASQPAIDNTTNNDHCGTCQACQACHTVALTHSPIEVAGSFTSPQLRPTQAAVFTSATTALGQKPPIS